MTMSRAVCLLLCVLVFFPCAGAHAAGDREGWPTHLRVLTGPKGGQWFTMGDPIAEVLSNNILPTTSRIGGGVANIASINSRRGDIGFTLASFLGAAHSGEEEYAALRADDAVLMVNIYPQVLYFLVRKDFANQHGVTDVRSLLELQVPLRFASLKPGTASEFILNLLFKYGYNTSFDRLREQGWEISFNNYAETADNFVAGDIDCFAYTAGTAVPLIKTMEGHTDVLILPVEQEVLDKLSAKFKTRTHIIMPGDYKNVTTPVRTLGDFTSLVVRRDLPENLVYAINETLWQSKGAIADVISDFGGLSPDTALPDNLEAHPGSVRFWSNVKGSR